MDQGYSGSKQVNENVRNVSNASKALSTSNLRRINANSETHSRSTKNLVASKSLPQTQRTNVTANKNVFNYGSRSSSITDETEIRRSTSDLEETGTRRSQYRGDVDSTFSDKKNVLNQMSSLQLRSSGSGGSSISEKKVSPRSEVDTYSRSSSNIVRDSASTANTAKTSNAAVSNKQSMLKELTSRHQSLSNGSASRSHDSKISPREAVSGKGSNNNKPTNLSQGTADKAVSDKRSMLNELASRQQSRTNGSNGSLNRKAEIPNRYDGSGNMGGKMQGALANYRVERTDSRKSPQTGFDAFSSQSFQNESFDFPSFDMEAVKKGSKKEEARKSEQKRGFFSMLSRDSKLKKSSNSSNRPNGEDSDTFNSSSLSDHMFNEDKFDYFNVGHR
jgi:hypothetical protein